MTERRFLLRGLPDDGVVRLSENIMQHVRVLRLAAGARVLLFDGAGKRAEAVLVDEEHARIERIEHVASFRAVSVAVPILKGDRQDWLVEKLCELGCAALVPVTCERSVINELSEGKRARMERIVEAACKQSGRDDLMRIEPLVPLLCLAPRAPTVLSPSAAMLLSSVSGTAERLLVIGPEGGLTTVEETALVAQGGSLAGLSGPILRAETAAIASLAIASQTLRGVSAAES